MDDRPLAPAAGTGKLRRMARTWLVVGMALALGGCGLAGTGVATTTAAQSAAEQAAEAKRTEDRVRQQIDAANSQAEAARRAAEAQAAGQ